MKTASETILADIDRVILTYLAVPADDPALGADIDAVLEHHGAKAVVRALIASRAEIA